MGFGKRVRFLRPSPSVIGLGAHASRAPISALMLPPCRGQPVAGAGRGQAHSAL